MAKCQTKEDFDNLGFCAIPPFKGGGVQKELELCTKRGVNQLKIFQSNRSIFKPNDIAQSPGRFQFGKPYLAICHLAKSGYLIRKCDKSLKSPENAVQDLVLQNCWGDMLHIYCTNSTSEERLSKPQYYSVESLTGKLECQSGQTECSIHRIQFTRDMQDCEFAYIGDYLCWKSNNKTTISVTNISQLRENADIGKGLSLRRS